MNHLGGPAWVLTAPLRSSSSDDVIVRCAAINTSGVVGEYQLGTNFVTIDPYQIYGLFATKLVTQHELIHWRIAQGPHPDRATLHLCRLVNEMPSGCWDHRYGRSLMNPSMGQSSSVPGFDDSWSGDMPSVEMTWMDGEFLVWGITP